MTSRFDDVFPTGDAPAWLARFETAPSAALDELLRGAVYLPAAEDPVLALVDWVLEIGDFRGFRTKLDGVLSDWIRERGNSVGAEPDPQDEARAWIAASMLVAYSPDLTEAASTLRPLV